LPQVLISCMAVGERDGKGEWRLHGN
jgi:hypothetical protein